VTQEKDWMDKLVDRISDWMDSLTEKDEQTKLATQFGETSKKKTETSSTEAS
jgi:hypothetical protein